MRINWVNIKSAGYGLYIYLLVGIICWNACLGDKATAWIFVSILGLHLIEVSICKVAEAIRTCRNFHIIGNGNEISLAGAELYADSVTVNKKRGEVRK